MCVLALLLLANTYSLRRHVSATEIVYYLQYAKWFLPTPTLSTLISNLKHVAPTSATLRYAISIQTRSSYQRRRVH
jgi:bacteriorhodopsin